MQEKLVKGECIGSEYIVDRVLGTGGFGIVYLMHTQDFQSIYAVKSIHPEQFQNPRVRDDLKREALVWLGMGGHPHIVRLEWVQEFNGCLYLAMEPILTDLIKAGYTCWRTSLHDQLVQCSRGFDRSQVFQWALQVCEGMVHAHANGLIAHRDLKPGNILVQYDGTAKISDFGLAVSGAELHGSSTKRVTGISGTVGYIAPEIYHGYEASPQSDIYAFGVILWQLLTGNAWLPYLAYVPQSKPRQIDVEQTIANQFNFDWPLKDNTAVGIVSRCVSKDRRHRYQDFETLRQALEGVLRLMGDHVRLQSDCSPPEATRLNNEGNSYAVLGKTEKAIQCHQSALDLDPGNPELCYNLASTYLKANRLEDAVTYFQWALEADPLHINAMANLAIALFKTGRIEESLQWSDRAIEARPQDAILHFDKAVSLEKLKHLREATAACRHALALEPGNTRFIVQLGNIKLRERQFEKAICKYDRALEIDKGCVRALVNKASALGSLGYHERALECCERAIRIDAANAEAWGNKAAALVCLERFSQAEQSCDLAIVYGLDTENIFSIKKRCHLHIP